MVKLWLAQEWRNGQAQAQQMPSTAGAVPGVGGGVGQEGLGGAGWSGEGWDENMMALCRSFLSPSLCVTHPFLAVQSR